MTATQISRRDFLRLSAVAAGGLFLAGCGGKTGVSPTAAVVPENYYRVNRGKILEDVAGIMKHIQKAGSEILPGEDMARLSDESISGFEKLLPDLPYIGGDKNELTTNLYQSAAALAFYRAMQARGHDAAKTGEVLFFAIKNMAAAMPMAGIGGRLSATALVQNALKADAERSRQRIYPEDWVFDFVPGDGTFDYGVDYIECGICKYLKAQKASELTPYMCLLDFPFSVAMDTGLVRTGTLARGDARCDFRYQAGRPVRMEWTPDFLKK